MFKVAILGEQLPGRKNIKVRACMNGAPMNWLVRANSASRADVLSSIAETIPTNRITQLEILGEV